MPSGFEAYNDGGFYQIDSNFKNFRLTNKQTLTLPGVAASPPELFPGLVDTAIAGTTPIVAVRSSVLCSIAMLRTPNPSLFTVRLASQDPGTATIYTFDQSPPSASTFGLQVFDAAGTQVFDANDKSLRVLDYYKQGSVLVGNVSSRTYAGKTTAVVVGGMLRFMNFTGPTILQAEYLLGCRTPSASQVDRGFFIYRRYLTGGSPGANYISSRNVTDLVVDVSNF